ncbi:hypothetical protein FKM82_001370 [Ascaphus truei]
MARYHGDMMSHDLRVFGRRDRAGWGGRRREEQAGVRTGKSLRTPALNHILSLLEHPLSPMYMQPNVTNRIRKCTKKPLQFTIATKEE